MAMPQQLTPAEQWVIDYLKANGNDVLYSAMYDASPYEHRAQLFQTIERLRAGELRFWWNGINPVSGKLEHRVKLPQGW